MGWRRVWLAPITVGCTTEQAKRSDADHRLCEAVVQGRCPATSRALVLDLLFHLSPSLQARGHNPADDRPRGANTPAGENVGWPVDAEIHAARPDNHRERDRHAEEIHLCCTRPFDT